jgi:hypothetical protein
MLPKTKSKQLFLQRKLAIWKYIEIKQKATLDNILADLYLTRNYARNVLNHLILENIRERSEKNQIQKIWRIK